MTFFDNAASSPVDEPVLLGGGPELPRGLPYGLWRRRAPRSLLDSVERARRDDEESWDLRHGEIADHLDALEGVTVRLLASSRTLTMKIQKGTRLVILGRVKDRLLARSAERLPVEDEETDRVVVFVSEDEVRREMPSELPLRRKSRVTAPLSPSPLALEEA